MSSRFFFTLALGLSLLGAAAPVYAQEKTDLETQLGAFAGAQGAGYAAPTDPRIVAANTIRAALTLIGVLFLCYTIYAGFLIMTAHGDEAKITKGKDTLRTAVIGVLVILSAYAITIFVTRSLTAALQGGNDGFEAGFGVQPGGASAPVNRDPLSNPPPSQFFGP
jgi:hypothetical protein